MRSWLRQLDDTTDLLKGAKQAGAVAGRSAGSWLHRLGQALCTRVRAIEFALEWQPGCPQVQVRRKLNLVSLVWRDSTDHIPCDLGLNYHSAGRKTQNEPFR